MEISIFNLNCWLLPTPLSPDVRKRLSATVELILERNPDIVTLQEVWSNPQLRYFKKHLPEYHCVSSGSSLYNQSGLVTFSKAKPQSSRLGFYALSRRHNISELIARKGYLEIDLEIAGEVWTVVNTHLYAAFSQKAERIVERQVTELLSRVSGMPRVFLCGDLNFSVEKFEKINKGKLQNLGTAQSTSDVRNPYSHRMFNGVFTGHENGKIDYIIQRGADVMESEYKVITMPVVSDHYPIYCRATLRTTNSA